jgi:hypothetical protein
VPPVLFRCPSTALLVQAWVDENSRLTDHYETISCAACNGFHLFNHQTGSVVGDDPAPDQD